jgi:hypothetical protein
MKIQMILRKAGNVVVNSTCSTIGALHFVTDTASDILLHAEACIMHRVYGEDKDECKLRRCIQTSVYQGHVLDKLDAIKDLKNQVANKLPFKSKEQSEVNELPPLVVVDTKSYDEMMSNLKQA